MIESLSLKSIRPPKYRLRDDIGDLEPLKASIKTWGLLEPIVVRSVKEHYEVVAGHRRYLASIELGLTEIDAIVKDIDDKTALELSLIENVERKTMDVIEEAKAYQAYTATLGYGSVKELAAKINRTPGYITERISLLKLGRDAFEGIRTGKMSPKHGEIISHLDSDKAEEMTRIITSADTGRPYLSTELTQMATALVRRGAEVEQAVQLAIDHPEWDLHKEHTKFDPISTARDSMVLTLEKAVIALDSNINILANGEEKAKWTGQIRYPTHQLVDVAMKLRKEYAKK